MDINITFDCIITNNNVDIKNILYNLPKKLI